MGLMASVYKDRGRSWSAGGISDTVDEVCVVNVEGPFEPTPDAPAVLLVPGNVAGTLKVVAADAARRADEGQWLPVSYPDKAGPMAGGCFVHTSDSRFAQACERILGHRFYGAVALHDRFESAAMSQALSS